MGANSVYWLTHCDLVAFPCLLIAGGKIRQQSEISIQVRKLPEIISNALDLVVGMIMCCRRPGPPAFLVNNEKLGVAWGRGYHIIAALCYLTNNPASYHVT